MSHLDQRADDALALLDGDRVEYIPKPRWIGHNAATLVSAELQNLLKQPAKHRMDNLLIVGETNNGRTRCWVTIGRSKSVFFLP